MDRKKVKTFFKNHFHGKKLAICLGLWTCLFTTSMSYLSLTSHTTWWTTILTSLTLSSFFCLAFCASSVVRAATTIFFPELLSPFGLVVTFFGFSWAMIIQPCSEKLIDVSQAFEDVWCLKDVKKTETTDFEELIGSLHYLPIFGLLLVFLYCLVYVVTHEVKEEKAEEDYISETSDKKHTTMKVWSKIFWGIMICLFIAVFTSCIWLSVGKKYALKALINTRNDTRCMDTERKKEEEGDFHMLAYYLFVCVLLIIFATFSYSFTQKRKAILQKLVGKLESNDDEGSDSVEELGDSKRKLKKHFIFFMKSKQEMEVAKGKNKLKEKKPIRKAAKVALPKDKRNRSRSKSSCKPNSKMCTPKKSQTPDIEMADFNHLSDDEVGCNSDNMLSTDDEASAHGSSVITHQAVIHSKRNASVEIPHTSTDNESTSNSSGESNFVDCDSQSNDSDNLP